MSPELFLADLEAKPETLRSLDVGDAWGFVRSPAEVLLLGMGSSHYANLVAAARLRAGGVPAVAELASSDLLPRVSAETLVVAVSASAGSVETLDAVDRIGAPFVALANRPGPLTEGASRTVWMQAGEERGGVACRSFQHTLALLLALESRLVGRPLPPVGLAADATADLIARAPQWRPRLAELLLGPSGTHVVAPARRLSSALQSALMLREGPRLPAVGCETGDWSHVDVYLTKTTDYRMLLLAGSRWEPPLLDWTGRRGSTVVAVGADVAGATETLRFRHDEVDDVRLLTETLVGELVAAHAWIEGTVAT